jgi:hypothetical protein
MRLIPKKLSTRPYEKFIIEVFSDDKTWVQAQETPHGPVKAVENNTTQSHPAIIAQVAAAQKPPQTRTAEL